MAMGRLPMDVVCLYMSLVCVVGGGENNKIATSTQRERERERDLSVSYGAPHHRSRMQIQNFSLNALYYS